MADSNPFSCDFCDKSFSTKANLKKHYIKFHGGVPESFHGLQAEKLIYKPCPKCGSVFKHLPKHLAICKAGNQNQAETVARKTTFISSTRGIKDDSLRREVEDESENDFIPRSPRKRKISDAYDLSDHFNDWMAAHGIGPKTRDQYQSSLGKFFGKLSIRVVQQKLKDLPNYLKGLETVNARHRLFLGHVKLVDYLKNQLGLDIAAFDAPTTLDYLDIYLKSEERKNLYHNFTNITKAMEMGWSADDIHDFLMGEVLLSNKTGKEFIFHCKLDDFLKVSRPDEAGRWWYEGKGYKVFFSDFLRGMLKSFAFIVRPKLVKSKTSHEVKLFELFEKKGKPCPKNGSVFRFVELFSKSLEHVSYNKVMEANFKFSTFKFSDFEGDIKGFNSKKVDAPLDESDEEDHMDSSTGETSNFEEVPMEIDHSVMETVGKVLPPKQPSPKPMLQPSPKPSTSGERPRRSQGSLNFSEVELKLLKSFFRKYKVSDLSEQTVMVVLQFEDGVEDLLDSKRTASGMADKQFWKALTVILQENM